MTKIIFNELLATTHRRYDYDGPFLTLGYRVILKLYRTTDLPLEFFDAANLDSICESSELTDFDALGMIRCNYSNVVVR